MPPVEIQWCDHSTVLLEYLRQLYDEGRFVDVGLECEGRQVKAHKAVISACSPYLEGLLKGNPARSHLIKFNGYSYKSLHAVIDFMYNGSVLVEQDQLAAFLKLGRALQVRGILDIAAQCEEAGLTTAEETKSNAQYSTTVQQSQKQQMQQQQQTQGSAVKQQQGVTESKKYAFMLDKQQTPTKKSVSPQQQQIMRNKPAVVGEQAKAQQVQVQQQQLQQQQQQQIQQQEQQLQQEQQQVQQQQQAQLQAADGSEVEASTLEEIQQALASGQALLQTDGSTGDQTLQMVEGQCVVTGSGQTYVVVQEGDNISFVPAEMVQGELQAAVNGGQVMEGLDPVEQQLAQMEGQTEGDASVATDGVQQGSTGNVSTSEAMSVDNSGSSNTTAQEQLVTSSEGNAGQVMDTTAVASDEGSVGVPTTGGGESLETMSVVESLVKLGEKQPEEASAAASAEGAGSVEVGDDMPSLDGSKPGGDEGINEEGTAVGEGGDGDALDASSQQQKEGEGASTTSPQRRSSSEWSQQGVTKKPKLS